MIFLVTRDDLISRIITSRLLHLIGRGPRSVRGFTFSGHILVILHAQAAAPPRILLPLKAAALPPRVPTERERAFESQVERVCCLKAAHDAVLLEHGRVQRAVLHAVPVHRD
eukprot:2541397-Prymnesium_polylepis.1